LNVYLFRQHGLPCLSILLVQHKYFGVPSFNFFQVLKNESPVGAH
jgi:hypothetical protein